MSGDAGEAIGSPPDDVQSGLASAHQLDLEDPLAPIPICQCAGGHQHRGAGDSVGIHDPLHIFEIAAQNRFKSGQDCRYARDFQAEH